MSEALEALNRIKQYTYGDSDEKDIKLIETTLNENQERIEELEETNHLMFIREHKNTKKLEALETIKEIIPIEERDFFYYKETDTYFFIGRKVSKEKYELLKEVLL